MNLDEYALSLGGLHNNLTSLEFALRGYLYRRADPPHNPLPAGTLLLSLKVGDIVPQNALTDYSTLNLLIDRYNKLVTPTHPELAVDPTIVDLRDALSHGRIIIYDSKQDMVLLKFSKPSSGRTSITYSQKLSLEWLHEQAGRVLDEVRKIVKAPGSPVGQEFPID